VLGLFLTFVHMSVGFTVVIWGGTLFLQRYLYNEPVSQVFWRAPLAALALTVFYAFWIRLDYRSPGTYNALFDYQAPVEDEYFEQFWSVKNKREILFKRERRQGHTGYYDTEQHRQWRKSDTEGIMKAIIVEDTDGQKVRFEAETTPDGKFKTAPNQPARYVEVGGRGRVMTEEDIGHLTRTLWGLRLANLFLNGFHLVAWFLCLWLLLRFQWSHALGLAFVAWLALTFFLPTLFKKAEDTARAVPKASAMHRGPLVLRKENELI